MRLLTCVYSLIWCTPVLGNVEKTIFLGPEPVEIHNPQQQPNIDSLRLEVLSPLNATLRRQLPAAFPNLTSPKGTETWFLLDRLRQQQRYEVRICWAATVRLVFLLFSLFWNPVFILLMAYLPKMVELQTSNLSPY